MRQLRKCSIERFYEEEKLLDVDEILVETRTLMYFKSMYVKHAFDAMGDKFKGLYDDQYTYLRNLKNSFKVRYES